MECCANVVINPIIKTCCKEGPRMIHVSRRRFIKSAVTVAAIAGWRAWANDNGLPEYYGDYLAEVERRVRSFMESCASGFFFITDPHVKSNHCKSGYIIAELVRRTGIRRVLCGGDIVEAFGNGYSTDKAAVDFAIDRFTSLWARPIRDAGGRLYSAKGNHDFTVRHSMRPEDGCAGFTYSGAEARRIILEVWTEHNIVTNASDLDGCYYYFDDEKSKIRYIVADTTDSETAGNIGWGVRYGIHAEQLRWLAGVAFKTVPRSYGVVVVHHIPVTTVVGTDGECALFAELREMLEAYQNRRKVVVGGAEYDFGDAGGEILFDLSGHHHAERQVFQNGVLHITEPCDAAYGDYKFGSAPWCGDLPEKKSGTIFEQTFDVIQIDRFRRVVHLTRVGGGQDRSIHYASLKAEVGSELKPEPLHLKDASKHGCYDCDKVEFKPNPANKYTSLIEYKSEFASVSDAGVIKCARKGEVMVVAMNRMFAKEIFPVTISNASKS